MLPSWSGLVKLRAENVFLFPLSHCFPGFCVFGESKTRFQKYEAALWKLNYKGKPSNNLVLNLATRKEQEEKKIIEEKG